LSAEDNITCVRIDSLDICSEEVVENYKLKRSLSDDEPPRCLDNVANPLREDLINDQVGTRSIRIGRNLACGKRSDEKPVEV
jgi:hypothetical protein